ncbi:hypothetical protein GQF03_00870 [Sneathiella chungangensis]|uniref:DUF6161 domain-containing protein n=1 Tax=Sneathiella chungangensis TaxID=1418234 RepID=A0A845M8S1_9PROT|nr:DUF6161 domain-containing protein [Sneathiella chungangensis]MZR20879.1 hypothetical protein [Sneathiella chungangensis]
MTGKYSADEPIEIRLNTSETFVFKDVSEIKEWLEDEINLWEEFSEKTKNEGIYRDRDSSYLIKSDLIQAKDALNGYLNLVVGDEEEYEDEYKKQVYDAFREKLDNLMNSERFVSARSSSGRSIITLSDYDPAAALMLLAATVGQNIPNQNILNLTKYIDGIARGRVAQIDATILKKSHEELSNVIAKDWNKIKDEIYLELSKNQKQNDDALMNVENSIKKFEDEKNKIIEKFSNFYKTATEQVQTLEDTYHKKLQLEAPATYWSSRKTNQRWAAALFAVIFIACILGALGLAYKYVDEIFAHIPRNNNGDIGLASIVVVSIPAAAIAWGLRVFAKLFIHNLNLASDAAQRQTMVATYLALANDEKANLGNDERILILNALFRPTDADKNHDAPPPNLLDIAKSASGKGA